MTTDARPAALEPHVAEALRRDLRRIVITGAGGWLGMATLELLDQALGDQAGARIRCFGSSARALVLRNGRRFEQRPLSELGSIGSQPTIVLHYAFLTKDRADAMSDEEYEDACRDLDASVIGNLESIGAEAAFVASSGAATKVDDPAASRGMRLYGSLKIEQERLFSTWAHDAGRRVVIGRLFNLSGPYMNKLTSYALSAFILDALDGRTIAVNATRPVVRAYVAIRELVSLVIAMLLDGPDGAACFETGGEAMEMAEIARTVSKVLGGGEIARASLESENGDIYAGDDGDYRTLLERYRISAVPFRQQVSETADFLTFLQKNRGAGVLA